jgi:hypothetical protein
MTFETCAPELVLDPQGHHDDRLDIWQVGCVAFTLATGRQPFETVEHWFQLSHRFAKYNFQVPSIRYTGALLVPSNSHLPEGFDPVNPILRRSLQLDPKKRNDAATLLAFITKQSKRRTQGENFVAPDQLPKIPWFTGQEELLEKMHERLKKPGKDGRSVELFGLAGSGKTALASQYALKFGEDYDSVIYLRCPLTALTLNATFGPLSPLDNEETFKDGVFKSDESFANTLIVIDRDTGHHDSITRNALSSINNLDAAFLILSPTFPVKSWYLPRGRPLLKVRGLSVDDGIAMVKNVYEHHYGQRMKQSDDDVCDFVKLVNGYPMALVIGATRDWALAAPVRCLRSLREDLTFLKVPVKTSINEYLNSQAGRITESLLKFAGSDSLVSGLGGFKSDLTQNLFLLSFLSGHNVQKRLVELIWEEGSKTHAFQAAVARLAHGKALDDWKNHSIIHSSGEHSGFNIEPYIQDVIFYNRWREEGSDGITKKCWKITRSALERFAAEQPRHSSTWKPDIIKHLARLLDACDPCIHSIHKLLCAKEFPTLSELFQWGIRNDCAYAESIPELQSIVNFAANWEG